MPLDHRVTILGISLIESKKEEVVSLMRWNVDLLAWFPYDMLVIYTREVFHHLDIDIAMNLISRRECKIGEEKSETIDEKVHKLRKDEIIIDVKLPSWQYSLG